MLGLLLMLAFSGMSYDYFYFMLHMSPHFPKPIYMKHENTAYEECIS